MQNTNNTDVKRNSKKAVTYINYNIRGMQVRLVEDNGQRVVSTREAIAQAEDQGLDLVQISYDKNSHMAVCKILDYGKWKYEQSKREKTAKKLARANEIELKTIQFSVATDDADKLRLINQAKEFLAEKDKVKLSIRFRTRRESANLDFARSVMKGILVQFEGLAELDSVPQLSGKEFSCIIRPFKATR